MLRWGLDGDIELLWQHQTGISGLISLAVTPLIAWPMLFTRLRKGMEFRIRKALHYLSIVWGVSICFHAPARWIGLIMGLAVGVYALDWLYGYFFKISHARTLQFKRIGNAVQVVWDTGSTLPASRAMAQATFTSRCHGSHATSGTPSKSSLTPRSPTIRVSAWPS